MRRRIPLAGPVLGGHHACYCDLPPGSYAVSLFQDANGNGRFDRNPAGRPVEPFGFSRDAMGAMGPPAFADAAIDLRADTTVASCWRCGKAARPFA